MVHFLTGLLILGGFMIYTHHYPDPGDLIWFPLVVLVQLVFSAGLALLVSALTVHFRDIRDLLANVLTLWFFVTPIIYFYGSNRSLPYVKYFRWNPFFHIAVPYQEVLFFHGPFVEGHLRSLLLMGAASVGLFLAGYWVFDRLRDSFAEIV